ncbi:hypothetical protein OU994_13220 [Pseudoduganella sp. SL102]|uniref:hypothetical protein n=1 Tax=Pseudoduganella sp. SL102 TaxID=2995154 RepID=UPI00248ADC2B|nr:hypothetical protein [Pseudoduganella sp. SL102]WBS05163.1 hypothetical protein OU994_13220 [Pseudoduganella sp. SL102]
MTAAIIGFVLLAAGTLAIYLASPHQSWLARPLPARPARVAGSLALLAALAAMLQAWRPLAAVFLFCTWTMLLFVAWPYLGAWRRARP